MKRFPFVLFAITALTLAANAADRLVPQHRGVWLHPEQYKTPELAAEWMAKIEAAHLNVIYPLVWHRGGTAWFKTALSPMAADVPAGFDPLGNLVKLARERGIGIHPWFVNGSYGAPAGKGLFATHPDWRLQTGDDASEVWYDLGKIEVRNFERDLMLDCLGRYEVDGLHFDYIRYSGKVLCYCDSCQREFAQKYGFRPLHPTEERFPVAQDVSSNPLGDPTTAQVLATFDHGVPAIAINRLGAGEVVLVNWQAARNPSLALNQFVKERLTRFGATAATTFQLHTTETAAKYHPADQERVQTWLKGLGFPARQVNEHGWEKVPASATLVLAGQYLISEAAAAQLERFVQQGGHCLFIDGPVFAIKLEALQRVVGLRKTDGFFHEWRVISPAPGQDLLKPGPPVDAAQEKSRMEKWVEYRKWTVSELVRAVSKAARERKPRTWINAAVFFRKQSADNVCQDWYGWLREGCVDYVLPMAYTEDNAILASAFAEWRSFDPTLDRIIPGLSLYSKRDGKAVARDLALVRSQLGLCRDNQSRGNQFFSLAFLNDPVIQDLAGTWYSAPAKPWYPPRR